MIARADETTRRRVEQAVAKLGLQRSRNPHPVAAYVNHGRWVADCPCGGAELVAPDASMLCGSCGGESDVTWPEDTAEIEQVLTGRPIAATRNWRTGEDVAGLVGENVARGV